MADVDVVVARTSHMERIGIPPSLAAGFLGLLLFMVGDGVEAGYLAPFLASQHFTHEQVGVVFTVYGITVAISSWLSGALCDQFGPWRVMAAGLGIWAVFEVLLLTFAFPSHSYDLILLTYGLRGFGYPLFAFGFLVWIVTVTPPERLSTAAGWFWFGFTGGLPTLGSLVASITIPVIGKYGTFWASLALVIIGGLVALFGITDRVGRRRLAPDTVRPLQALVSALTIVRVEPKVGIGGIVRLINTTSEYGFLVFMPAFFTQTIGFSLEQWLRLLSVIFIANIIANLVLGWLGDRIGWRTVVTWIGAAGCAVTTLLLYYLPMLAKGDYLVALGAGALYGITLAGFVPLSALMPMLTPNQKGASMSILNLGAGLSTAAGPLIVVLFRGPFGIAGIMWIFAILYVIAFVLARMLDLPQQMAKGASSGH
jgi:polyol permease family